MRVDENPGSELARRLPRRDVAGWACSNQGAEVENTRARARSLFRPGARSANGTELCTRGRAADHSPKDFVTFARESTKREVRELRLRGRDGDGSGSHP